VDRDVCTEGCCSGRAESDPGPINFTAKLSICSRLWRVIQEAI